MFGKDGKAKVLLIGDSIREQYQKGVQRRLSNVADVFDPGMNGRSCFFTMRYLPQWIANMGGRCDIIHFNTGLWDVIRMRGEDRTVSDIGAYSNMIVRIYENMRYWCPDARIIFATTTSILEPSEIYYETEKEKIMIGIRRNEDICMFNEAAINELRSYYDNVLIDDLWSLSLNIPNNHRSDSVHFDTEPGRNTLAAHVADFINNTLQEIDYE